MTGRLLRRDDIEDAFRRLGDRLARRGVVADVYVFGGAAMALAFDERRATRDIDALFQPPGKVLASRTADRPDIALLVRRLNLTTVDDAVHLCREVFPDEPVPDRARLVLEDILGVGDG